MAKYLIFIALILLIFTVGPYLLFGVPEAATNYGIAMVSAETTGIAVAALAIGALGLLNKRNQFAGFVIVTFIAIGFMFAGANAQTNCQFDGTNVKLCDVPSNWQTVTPRAHASAEFRGNDGFFAQLIIDPAGSTQQLTLSAAADAVISNAQDYTNSVDFEVLMRGTNAGIRNSEIVVYKSQIEGVPFVFANTIYVGHNETIQMITWRISNELTIQDRAAHLDFISSLVLMPNF